MVAVCSDWVGGQQMFEEHRRVFHVHSGAGGWVERQHRATYDNISLLAPCLCEDNLQLGD